MYPAQGQQILAVLELENFLLPKHLAGIWSSRLPWDQDVCNVEFSLFLDYIDQCTDVILAQINTYESG